MSTYPALELDIMAATIQGNPYPIFARLRSEAPIWRSTAVVLGGYPWLATRYEDCMTLLKETNVTKDVLKRPGTNAEDLDPMTMAINRHMLTVDPPDHTRLRGLVHKAFTPRVIQNLKDRVQKVADSLLEAAVARGEIDLIADYATPLPVTIIAELLGVPVEDQTRFRGWAQTIVIEGTRGGDMEKVGASALEFIMYFNELFERRRAEPKDDLISALLQVEEQGDMLDQQELLSMVFLLLVAGFETTVNLIGNGALNLIRHPDQMALLRANPDLMPNAIEEMLRIDGPVAVGTMRWALEDFEIGGQTIPAGEQVLPVLLSANRDPQVFEDPNRFDITRTPGRHLAFGSGIHYCLGAPLARMEGAIAIEALLRHAPALRLTVPEDQLTWQPTLLIHGLTALPVALR